jgi:PTH1 family peptidyl-tRNA hydrolase
MLLKPTTYMNSSGLAVSEACRYFNIPPEQILLVYDDIDLPLGKLRFRSAGGTGGHRGVESVIYHLQTDNFARLRLGIATEEPMRPAETYVLQPFPKGTEEQVTAVINTAVEGLDYFLTHGITATMNQYN